MLYWDLSVLLETPLINDSEWPDNLTLLPRPSWALLVLMQNLFDFPSPASLWEWFPVLECSLSTIWQCLMKPFILQSQQSKQHHYFRKKTCTPRPLSPFRLWHFLDGHLLDPRWSRTCLFLTGSSCPRWQNSLTPRCSSLPSCVGFVTLIHRYDSRLFDASWVNCTYINGKLRVCCSQWLGKVMVRRVLAEDLGEGWELSVYSIYFTALIFIFPLSNCSSQRGYRWPGKVVN